MQVTSPEIATDRRMKSSSAEPKPKPVWRWLAIIAASCFLLSTIKPGQKWDGDAELFILNSLNILHGQPYASTNYVLNPTNPLHPSAYPPGLPMLLAPVIAMFGINYIAMKVMITLSYIGMLVVVASMSGTFISEALIIVFIISLGLNPFVWSFKDVVFSEFPFMLFAYLGLFTFDQLDQAASGKCSRTCLWIWTIACSMALALAYETRAIGITLLAAVAAMCVWRFKTVRYFGPAVLFLALAFSAFISWMFPADLRTYISNWGDVTVETVEQLIRAIPSSSAMYRRAIEEILAGSNGWSAAQKIIVTAVLAASALGVALKAVNRLTVYEAFLVAYLGTLLLYPISIEPFRYALPILPLVILYFLYVVHKWKFVSGRPLLKPSIVFVMLGILYLPQYAGSRKEEISVDGLEAQELYREIRERVPPDAIILCQKPTIIALYGERHVTNPPKNLTPEQFWRVVDQTKATWLVELKTPLLYDKFSKYDRFSKIIPKLQADFFDLEFSNRLFSLYHILAPRPAASIDMGPRL